MDLTPNEENNETDKKKDFLRKRLPFRVEYAATDRSKCVYCRQTIEKKHLKMTYIKDSMFYDGPQTSGWLHINCFFNDLMATNVSSNYLSVQYIEHFGHLKHCDQQSIATLLIGVYDEVRELTQLTRLMDIDEEYYQIDRVRQDRLNEQSQMLYGHLEQLEQMSNNDIKKLLAHNGIRIAKKNSSRLYTLADAMTFGVPEKCPNCIEFKARPIGQLLFRICGYICSMGSLTELVGCDYYTTEQPKRSEFKIPGELTIKYEFLREYQFVSRDREYNPELQSVPEMFNYLNEDQISKLEDKRTELDNTSDDDTQNSEEPMDCDYNRNAKTSPIIKIFLKNGYSVDRDSGLTDSTHIYKTFDKSKNVWIVYNAVLTAVRGDRNSYYLVQLLESDGDPINRKYYIFLKWGRIGGHHWSVRPNSMSLDCAIKKFESVYFKQTGCTWPHFQQQPRKYFSTNIENFKEKLVLKSIESKDTKHCKPIKDLICMIFDAKKLKDRLFEFKIDQALLPLGLLSDDMIRKGNKLLGQVLPDLLEPKRNINKNNRKREIHLMNFSLSFYQNIPHISPNPLPFKTMEEIKEKQKLLSELSDIQITYEMLCSEEPNQLIEDPIDYLIGKLNIQIEFLDNSCPEYKAIKDYATIANNLPEDVVKYDQVDILNIFKIKRNDSLFEKQMKDKPKLLLWHGSQTIRFASILSKGLLINPEGVRDRVSTFGKGLYFADLITHSIDFCRPNNSTEGKALLLLCEIIYENIDENDGTQNRDDVDCVKYLGRIGPDDSIPLPNNPNTCIPFGQLKEQKTANKRKEELIPFNEYLVKKSENIGIKYLVEIHYTMKPKPKQLRRSLKSDKMPKKRFKSDSKN